MIAETIGMLRLSAGSSPRRNFTSGVLSDTLSGMFSAEEYPGTSRYSEKVWDSPSKNVAMFSGSSLLPPAPSGPRFRHCNIRSGVNVHRPPRKSS